MKIAIDIDGVVIDLVQSWINQFHPEIKFESITEWNISKCTPYSWDQIMVEFDTLDYSKLLFCDSNMVSVLHTLEIMQLFTHNEFFFLTNKTDANLALTKKFFKSHKISIPIIQNIMPKHTYDYDLLIDDKLEEYLDNNRCILINRPWNHSNQVQSVTKSLEEALQLHLLGFKQYQAIFKMIQIATNITLL